MGKRIDIDNFVKYLEGRGGGIHAVRAGQVASRLANVIGVPPYSVTQFLRRMENKGLITVDRGHGSRFIYGVSLVRNANWYTTGEKDLGAADIYGKAEIIDKWDGASPDLITSDQTQATGTVDYSVLAGKLLEQATDAIAENERLRERIKYLEGKVQEQPQLHLTEQRHNVIKDLLHQVGQD